LATQVDLGAEDGLKHESSIHCDALVSLPKSMLTDFVARLAPVRMRALDQALRVALALA
jgi:mRNA interferase MazF